MYAKTELLDILFLEKNHRNVQLSSFFTLSFLANTSMYFPLSVPVSFHMMLLTDRSRPFHSPLQEKAVKGSSHLPTAKHE